MIQLKAMQTLSSSIVFGEVLEIFVIGSEDMKTRLMVLMSFSCDLLDRENVLLENIIRVSGARKRWSERRRRA